jgi:PIN domain nuclease of toxin-antitoxin system
MRYLLDTHIWIWSLLAPEHLTRRVVRALENRESELWLSPISTWELLVLVRKGRVRLNKDVEDWIDEAMSAVPLREAPLTHEVALETNRIELPHRDPADAFLAATARVFDLTLITSDDRLIRTKDVSVLANR